VLSIGKLSAGQASYYLDQAEVRVDAIEERHRAHPFATERELDALNAETAERLAERRMERQLARGRNIHAGRGLEP
jgi:hypothetical protein